MRLRELLVVIKVKADLAEAMRLEAVLNRIANLGLQLERSMVRAARAADRLDKSLSGTARAGKAANEGVEGYSKAAQRSAKASDDAARAADKAGDKMVEAGRKAKQAAQEMAVAERKRDSGGRFTGGGKGIGGKIPELPGAQSLVQGGLMAGAAGIGLGAGLFAQVAGERESLRETLKNLEGDEAKAAETFGRIEKFAATTPYAIEEVTGALIKLKAQGLDSTDDALRSYGDLASTFGKSMDDMVEAVKDATTGENERLKEFGITAKTQGDQVSFTFKGQTTVVEKNAEAIEKYIQSLGKMNGIAGAMAGQMGTLKGVWSNFQDTLFSAIDQAAQSSGVLDEMKGLLGDVTDSGADAAGVFGEFLADAIRDLRTWIQSLTREQIQDWLERAAEFARTTIETMIGLATAITEVVTVVAELIEGFGGADEMVQILILSLGALALAGGGLPGIFAAAAVAAVAMAIKFGGATDKVMMDVKRLQNAGIMKAYQDAVGPMSQGWELDPNGTGPTVEESIQGRIDERKTAEGAIETIQKANRTGLGEEFFRTAEEQLVELGVEKAVEEGDLAGQAARASARGDMSPEEILAYRGGDARIGVNKEADKFLDAVESKRAKDIEKFRDQAKKRGLDEDAIQTVVDARTKELDDRSTKAAQAFTKSIRKSGDIDKAIEAGLKELDDKEKKKKGGKGKSKKDKNKDILQALGLKGPGSILENRPAPQSLLIQTTIVTKAAEHIAVHVELPKNATLEQSKETIGNEVGKAVDEAARKQLQVIFDDAWSLRWEELAKARGGGRVPKSTKKRGGV